MSIERDMSQRPSDPHRAHQVHGSAADHGGAALPPWAGAVDVLNGVAEDLTRLAMRVAALAEAAAPRAGLPGPGEAPAAEIVLDADAKATLNEAARGAGVEAPHLLLALWCVVLGRLRGETELPLEVSLPVGESVPGAAGQQRAVPLALRVEGAATIGQVARDIRAGLGDACGEGVAPEVGASFTCRAGAASPEGEGFQLAASQAGGALYLTIRGEAAPARGLSTALGHLIDHVRDEGTATAISVAPLASPSDVARIRAWGTGPVVPEVGELSALFAEAFQRHGDRCAVTFRGEQTSYAALDRRSRQIAARLLDEGVGVGDIVGTVMPASTDHVATMLAVKRIGAAWLPMQADDPDDRLRTVIETARPVKVVCSREKAAQLGLGAMGLVLEDGLPEDGPLVFAAGGETELAYVIFTSGSTGRPKGVRVTNGALANFLVGMPEALGWRDAARVGCLTTPSFDIYVLETLLTLVRGGTVVIADAGEVRTPGAIAAFVRDHDVDYLQMTPSRLRLLHADPTAAATALACVDKLFVGGEAFPEDLLEGLWSHRSLQIHNVFGPTETCIWSSTKALPPGSRVSLGSAIANTTLYVLDDQLHVQPEGFPGDIWIGGRGVSPGYLNRPDLNADVFRTSPHGGEPMYRTGDRGVWRDGELHYLGRTDNQVKIRGVRIELEEIERAIAQHPSITGAATILDEVSPGNHILRSFFVTRAGEVVDAQAVKDRLMATLPAPMVPATLVEVPDLPMTNSGKVDRGAVARRAQDLSSWAGRAQASARMSDVVADVGGVLLSAWRSVLGNVTIDAGDSFFDLGGNSLNVMMLREELNRALPGPVEVTELFAHATFGRLQEYLERRFAAVAPDGEPGGTVVRLPAVWFTSSRAASGRVEAELPATARRRLADVATRSGWAEGLAFVHVTVALALHKLLGVDGVTIWMSESGSRAWPTRIDFSGRSDVASLVQEHAETLRRGAEAAVGVVSPHSAGEGAASIVCLIGPFRGNPEVLHDFDIVIGVDDPHDPATVILHHARRLTALSMERLLTSVVKLLGVLLAGATPSRPMSTRGE